MIIYVHQILLMLWNRQKFMGNPKAEVTSPRSLLRRFLPTFKKLIARPGMIDLAQLIHLGGYLCRCFSLLVVMVFSLLVSGGWWIFCRCSWSIMLHVPFKFLSVALDQCEYTKTLSVDDWEVSVDAWKHPDIRLAALEKTSRHQSIMNRGPQCSTYINKKQTYKRDQQKKSVVTSLLWFYHCFLSL